MQVLCMLTDAKQCDAECPECHQRYSVYYSRNNKVECEEALEAVRATLREHHTTRPRGEAHPDEAFNVPAWSGQPHASGAALLSGAPIRKPLPAKPVALTVAAGTAQRRAS